MQQDQIQKMLSDLLVGATILSMKVAGPELEIFFTGGNSGVAELFSVDTDARIFVGKGSYPESEKLQDEDFFAQRCEAIVGIYKLTGYDVDSVSVFPNGSLDILVEGVNILILPEKEDSWDFIVHESKGPHGYIGFHEGQGFRIRA
ncbi:hypothetical protein [Thiohalomonas denitrificans]|uniref:hypothetical protein n=1 Tax=Thiohalomonas denitrificans TaxID=415747 RepID=UPI0026EC7D26|nr:hypothetical protein [Thiohalomonas denitrificans]